MFSTPETVQVMPLFSVFVLMIVSFFAMLMVSPRQLKSRSDSRKQPELGNRARTSVYISHAAGVCRAMIK